MNNYAQNWIRLGSLHGATLKGTDDLVGNSLADVVLVWHG